MHSFLRSWPRTRLRSPWTESCTSVSVTPSPLWPTWSTPTSPPACWLRPHSGMSSEPRTWRSSCPTARASLTACRCVCTQRWTRRRCLRRINPKERCHVAGEGFLVCRRPNGLFMTNGFILIKVSNECKSCKPDTQVGVFFKNHLSHYVKSPYNAFVKETSYYIRCMAETSALKFLQSHCGKFSETFARLVAFRATWTKPQTTGASRWSGWRLKTSSCHSRCREPWLLRRRRLARPEQRLG